jgi:hypothetical protein
MVMYGDMKVRLHQFLTMALDGDEFHVVVALPSWEIGPCIFVFSLLSYFEKIG